MAHGGKRTGAGRPAVKLSRTGKALKRITAEQILAALDEQARWDELLNAQITIAVGKSTVTVPDYRIRIDAMKYLTNRRDGMPAQAMKHSGPEGDDPIKVILYGGKANGHAGP